jgi:uncharacterized protein YbbK (DUF523 family)
MILVSACLVGLNCNYEGTSKPHAKVVELINSGEAIPFCPEIYGGLSTPRDPAERKGDKVLTIYGDDVTRQFYLGADEGLRLAKMVGCKEAILKARSPSCGCGSTYDGTFSGKLVDGDGVFAELLKKNDINVRTEEEFEDVWIL